MNPEIINSKNADKEQVLTKAVLNMASFYHLTGKDLANIIGISEPSVTRLYQGKKTLSPSSKEGELALLLLRIYRSLNAIVGNNHEKAYAWLNSSNQYFSNQHPIELIKTVAGLVEVANYLDAMRGKI